MQRWSFQLVGLLFLIVCVLYSGKKLYIDGALESNILGWIPKTSSESLQNKALDELLSSSERSFIVLLSGGESSEQGLLAAKALQRSLASAGLLPHTNNERVRSELMELYFPYRQQLLSTAKREWLLSTDVNTIADTVLTQLYSPVRMYRPYSLIDDPFNLAADWQMALLAGQTQFLPSDIPSILDGGIYWYMVVGELNRGPFDQKAQRELLSLVAAVEDGNIRVLRSGLVFHAAAGAKLAQSEISTVGLGSLLGIVLLVVLVFRSLAALWSITLVLLSSTIVAVTACLLIFDSLHLVTLAFGATLLGLAADYCFHFLVKWRSCENAEMAAKLIRQGVLLSLASSAVAYLLQLISPFPGLQQFAVFVTAGLMTACAMVLFFLPPIMGSYSSQKRVERLAGPDFFQSWVLPGYQGLVTKPWWVATILFLAVVMALGWVLGRGFSDDVRLLNTSSDKLIESERKVSQLTSRLGSQQFFIVKGQDEQAVLEDLEWLLDALNNKQAVNTLFSMAQFVPSLSRQRQDYQLIQSKLYGPKGALLVVCQSLPDICKQDQVQGFLPALIPSAVPRPLREALHLDTLMADKYSVALPAGSWLDVSQSQLIASSNDRVEYIDNVRNISGILKSVREQVGLVLMVFIIGLSFVSLWLFKRDAWPLLISLLLTVIFSLTVSASEGVTLFHILALLLVLGITVDTSIFFIKLGFNKDTWLASTLSCGTSLLAFGLLSFSQVAVLAQFGAVVFSGLICAWLLTPLVFCLLQIKNDSEMNGAY